MFGIGMPEMILILAVALIVFGPKKLPELAKSLGRALGEFKRATSDLKDSIETETSLSDVRKSLKEADQDLKKSLDTTQKVRGIENRSDKNKETGGEIPPQDSIENVKPSANAAGAQEPKPTDTKSEAADSGKSPSQDGTPS